MADASVPSKKYRVLVVDDHPAMRYGYTQLIDREPDMETCGEAANVADAMRQAESRLPDAAVVDIILDGEDGIELIEHMKSRWPELRILVSSSHDEETFAGRVLRAGALGYVSKREPMTRIVEGLRQVLRNEVYLSPQMTTRLLQRAAVGKSLDPNPVETLSNRELQVFEMIGQGLTTVQIADKLQLSPKTVESHRKLIKTKLNLTTAAQLSRRAFQWVQEAH